MMMMWYIGCVESCRIQIRNLGLGFDILTVMRLGLELLSLDYIPASTCNDIQN